MESSTYKNAKLIETSRLFVNVVAHHETTHGTKEIPVGKEKKTVCKVYPTITCEEHKHVYEQARDKFSGIDGVPATIFCDPTGKELDRELGGIDAGPLKKKMEDILKQVPGEKLPMEFWKAGVDAIREGDAKMEKGEYAAAIKLYKKVAGMKPKALKSKGEEALQKANDKGNELVAAAKLEAEGGDKEKAKKDLKKIVDDFKGLECSKEAEKLLKELK